MPFLNHTWRLALSVAALTVLFIALFIFMARGMFADDKTGFVLQSQRQQVLALGEAFDRQLERAIFEARAVQVSPATQKIFWENPALLAIELGPAEKPELSLEKLPGLLTAARRVGANSGRVHARAIGNDRFAVALQEPGTSVVRVVFEAPGLLPAASGDQVFALALNGRVLQRTPDAQLEDNVLADFLKRNSSQRDEQRRIGRHRFAVSTALLGSSDVTVAAMTPVAPVLQPLNALFYRSLLFLLFAALSSTAIAAALSRQMSFTFAAEMTGETARRVETAREEVVANTSEASWGLVK
jgi:hypothetical protein